MASEYNSDARATAIKRSLRFIAPSVCCSISITPTRLQSSKQPGNNGSSVRTRTSSGSPSSGPSGGYEPEVVRKHHAFRHYLRQFVDAFVRIVFQLIPAAPRCLDDNADLWRARRQ